MTISSERISTHLDASTGRRGEVQRGSEEYEAVRQALVSQALKPERYPDRIIAVGSADEVADLVREAVMRGERVSARGSGHNYHGGAVREGGLLLDLSGLTDVEVDVETKTAWVGAGVKGAGLGAGLDPYNLAFPGPHDGRVCVAGFLLAGGMGHNLIEWGPSCLRILAVDVVTATGERLIADADNSPDLLAAARGGGPGFPGIVLRFKLQLSDRPKIIRDLAHVVPLFQTADMGHRLDAFVEILDPRSELSIIFVPGPQGGFGLLVFISLWADSVEDADEMEKAFAAAVGGEPVVYDYGSVSDVYAQFLEHDFERQELRRQIDNFWINDPISEWLPGIAAQMEKSPSPDALVLIVAAPTWKTIDYNPDNAVYSKGATWFIEPAAAWAGADGDAANKAWFQQLIAPLGERSVGHYIASVDREASEDRLENCFEPAHWARLQETRKAYDPFGTFHPMQFED